MPQDEQLDVFGELIAPASDQQPEHGREGEIGERKEHSAILPSAAPEEPAKSRVRGSIGCAVQPDLVFARARETARA
jgi:hypothetical protein